MSGSTPVSRTNSTQDLLNLKHQENEGKVHAGRKFSMPPMSDRSKQIAKWTAVAVLIAAFVTIGLLAHFGVSPISQMTKIGMYTMFGAAGALALGAAAAKCKQCIDNKRHQDALKRPFLD